MTNEDSVNEIFSRLAAGELTRRDGPLEDGWETELPSGRTVTRSALQSEAGALVALGPDAVPHILPWVSNENAALRYAAAYALEQLTGEKPYLPYFDRDDREGNRARAVEVWRSWYEARK